MMTGEVDGIARHSSDLDHASSISVAAESTKAVARRALG